MRIEIEAPTEANQTEAVSVTLRITNDDQTPLALGLTGGPPAFNIVVRSSKGVLVWSRLNGETVSMILEFRVVPPGGMLEFTDEWNLRDNAGEMVQPGIYYVQGSLPTDEGELSSEIREIFVRH